LSSLTISSLYFFLNVEKSII